MQCPQPPHSGPHQGLTVGLHTSLWLTLFWMRSFSSGSSFISKRSGSAEVVHICLQLPNPHIKYHTQTPRCRGGPKASMGENVFV
uniref:Secreted protein n=1 Tax=Knipowitschia caucasica TaxID=637954 RepID=A0AAV2J446_KNICA